VPGGGPRAFLLTARGRVELGTPMSGGETYVHPGAVTTGITWAGSSVPAVVPVKRGERVTVVFGHVPTRYGLGWKFERVGLRLNRHKQVTGRVRWFYGVAQLELAWVPTSDDPEATQRYATGYWPIRFVRLSD